MQVLNKFNVGIYLTDIKQAFNVLLGSERNSDIYFLNNTCFHDYEIAVRAQAKYFFNSFFMPRFWLLNNTKEKKT